MTENVDWSKKVWPKSIWTKDFPQEQFSENDLATLFLKFRFQSLIRAVKWLRGLEYGSLGHLTENWPKDFLYCIGYPLKLLNSIFKTLGAAFLCSFKVENVDWSKKVWPKSIWMKDYTQERLPKSDLATVLLKFSFQPLISDSNGIVCLNKTV